MKVDKISKNITFAEATASEQAAKNNVINKPTKLHLAAMVLLAEKVFEPLRAAMKGPIKITSFYRSPEVNSLIKGSSKTSQHCLGEAMDIIATKKFTNRDMFIFIVEKLDFDQVIWEGGDDSNPAWVHVSYKAQGNRKQILQMKIVDGKPTYTLRKDLSFIKYER